MRLYEITEVKEITINARVRARDAREAELLHRKGVSYTQSVSVDRSSTIEKYEEETTHGK
ncbi:hypothetical protein [Terribacillus sp. DMT04]|uniref:hypothetical protein n=1 Tax=Terribacillus sp. DMT04 TaxID=2850441 RepID=UPI001C2BDCC5|nr:hypothetical protein [Terribacillus sp. DMT04]QXE02796.1 hypothetical protein KS242_06345 [Terribacillus sp. DMT04]